MDNTPLSGQTDKAEGVVPGETITPASVASSATTASVEVPTAALATNEIVQTTSQPIFEAATPDVEATPRKTDDQAISWVAAEFIAHNKSASWYAILALVVLVIATIVFLFTRDKISTAVVIIAGIALAGYGARQPQQRRYVLDGHGIRIDDKYIPYDAFRSFSIIDEGHVSCLSFFPLKRFGQLTTAYYDPKDEADIIALLADRLPVDDHAHDMLDRFMKRIRF